MEDCGNWVFMRKPDAEQKKGIRSYIAIALTSVMSKWYASCIILRLEKKKNLRVGRNWTWRRKLPAPASYDDQFASKTLGVAGGEDSHVEVWQRGASDNVFGKLGRPDGVR